MNSEILDLVDNNDNVIGTITRKEMEKQQNKNVRTINVLIYNEKLKIITPIRSRKKETFPGCYDFSVGGYVSSGESYIDAAKREMEEELGIKDLLLEEVGYFNPFIDQTSSYTKLYKTTYNGEIKINKDELEKVNYFTEDEILEKINKSPEKFKYDYKIIIPWYIKNKKIG